MYLKAAGMNHSKANSSVQKGVASTGVFESPKPHTRERLTPCVYLIITIKKSFCVLGLLWDELCQQRGNGAAQSRVCVQGQRAVRQKEPHLAPASSRGEAGAH